MNENSESVEESEEERKKLKYRYTRQVLDRGKILNVSYYSNEPSEAALTAFAKSIIKVTDQIYAKRRERQEKELQEKLNQENGEQKNHEPMKKEIKKKTNKKKGNGAK